MSLTLTEKLTSPDHDFRYMALNDLIAKPSEAESYVPTILKLALSDQNDQVSSLACKVLGAVVKGDGDCAVVVFRSLCDALKGEQFDHAMLGLKICMSDMVQGVQTGAISKLLIAALVTVVGSQELNPISQSSQLADVLQLLAEVLSGAKFKQYIDIVLYEDQLQTSLMDLLQSKRVGATKRASVAMAALSSHLALESYMNMVNQLMHANVSYINTLCLLAKDNKFASFASDAFKLVVKYIPNIDELEGDVDYEMTEVCLQLTVTLVSHLGGYSSDLFNLALKWIDFDPNRVGNLQDDDMQLDNQAESDQSSEYTDDDDESWKLRRMAALLSQQLFDHKYMPNDIQLQKFTKSLTDSASVQVYKLSALESLVQCMFTFKGDGLTRKRKSIDVSANVQYPDQFSLSARTAVLTILKQIPKMTLTVQLQAYKVLSKLTLFEIMPFATQLDKLFTFAMALRNLHHKNLNYSQYHEVILGEVSTWYNMCDRKHVDVSKVWPIVLQFIRFGWVEAIDALEYIYAQSNNTGYLVQALKVSGTLESRICRVMLNNKDVNVLAIKTMLHNWNGSTDLKCLLDCDKLPLQVVDDIVSLYPRIRSQDRVILAQLLQKCDVLNNDVRLDYWFADALQTDDQKLMMELLYLKSVHISQIIVNHFEVVFGLSTEVQLYESLARHTTAFESLEAKASQVAQTTENSTLLNNAAITLSFMNGGRSVAMIQLARVCSGQLILSTALAANLSRLKVEMSCQDQLLKLLEGEVIDAAKHNAAVALGYMAQQNKGIVEGIMQIYNEYRLVALFHYLPDESSPQAGSDHQKLWQLLFTPISSSSLQSDCIAKMLKTNASAYSQLLLEQIKSNEVGARTLVFQVLSKVDLSLSQYYKAIESMDDVSVHQAALNTVLLYTHNNVSQVKNSMTNVLAYVMGQTSIRKDLIQIVEVGIFKHQVDNGLEIRKLAYECLYSLMQSPEFLQNLAPKVFTPVIVSALNDSAYEIKSVGLLMLQRVVSLSQSVQVYQEYLESDVQFVSELLNSIKPLITPNLKTNAIKSEVEKLNDMSEQSCRALLVIARQLAVVCVKNGQLELCPDQVKASRINLYNYLNDLKKQPTQWKRLNKVV